MSDSIVAIDISVPSFIGVRVVGLENACNFINVTKITSFHPYDDATLIHTSEGGIPSCALHPIQDVRMAIALASIAAFGEKVIVRCLGEPEIKKEIDKAINQA